MVYTTDFVYITRKNFFQINGKKIGNLNKGEEATEALISSNIRSLTENQLLNLLYVNGDPTRGKKGVHPCVYIKNEEGKDVPLPMQLIASHQNNLFAIYRTYFESFEDKIACCMGGVPQKMEALVYDERGSNLCHIAARVNNMEAIDRFPDWMATEKDILQQTPIHVAAKYGYKEAAIKLFLKAKPLTKLHSFNDINGETPARVAIRSGYIDVALALIEAGDFVFYSTDRNKTVTNEEVGKWLKSLYSNDKNKVRETFITLLKAQKKRTGKSLSQSWAYINDLMMTWDSPESTLKKEDANVSSTESANPEVTQETSNQQSATPALANITASEIVQAAPVTEPQETTVQNSTNAVTNKAENNQVENKESPTSEQPALADVTVKSRKDAVDELREEIIKAKKLDTLLYTFAELQRQGFAGGCDEIIAQKKQERDALQKDISTKRLNLKVNAAFESAMVCLACNDFSKEQIAELKNALLQRE